MKLKPNDSNGEFSYFAVPVKRKFNLSSLDVSVFACNF
jgi:hypothetical protein